MRLSAVPFCALILFLCVAVQAKAADNVTGDGDAAHGALIFGARCSQCHFFDANKFGPTMHGVYGRRAGSVPDYDYSDALKNSNIVWNEKTLNKWLINPSAMAPGTSMLVRVPVAKDRADIIAYLKDIALPNNRE